MTEVIKDSKNRPEDRLRYLLDRARSEFFKGKISQAAYLWEKVLESDPDNAEASACRAYIRKNSIGLRARANGRKVDVEPPPVFLERNENEVEAGVRRFSSTDELEWPDPEDDLREEMSEAGGVVASDSQEGDSEPVQDDEEAVMLPSPPQIEGFGAGLAEEDSLSSSGELGERDSENFGDQVRRNDSFDVFDDTPTIARDNLSKKPTSAFGHVLGGATQPDSDGLPKPSTTLSGMPASEVLPRGFFEMEEVKFSASDDLGEEAGGDADMDDEPTMDRGSFREREALDDLEVDMDDEPTRERGGLRKQAGLSADIESEALLDPRKGLVRARELFRAGRHTESMRICELIEKGLPANADLEDLVEQNREMLESIYIEKLGDLSVVPRVELGSGHLQDIKMDHKTAFLLTRIDGMLTLEDVMSIAGMTRLDAAKMLLDAIEQGIIVLDG